jgi:hypothetical protein
VLSYVGPGHYLFVTPISNLWKEAYSALEQQQLTAYDEKRSGKTENTITCVSQMTLYSSVFASLSRVRLAHESGLDYTSEAYQLAAGRHADVATLAVAQDLGMQYTAKTMSGAAQCNKLAEVQYLHSQGCPWSPSLLSVAASSGYSELLRWCYGHGCPCIKDVSFFAAQSGNVELIAWMLQQDGTHLSELVMWAAVAGGHKAMCQFLRSKQCPWNEYSPREAAAAGHVDLLRWLIDSGCPYYVDQLRLKAAEGGSVEVLTCLQQRGLLTGTPILTALLNWAAKHNQLAAAKWLRAEGAEWPLVFMGCRWSDEVLAWARAEGCTTSTS